MKNDYDDYDDYETGASKWVSIMVLLLAVAGFVALAWYAYQTGSQQAQTASSDVVVVEADKTPIKDKPEEPGGMEFPHQEKTIFDALSPAPNDATSDGDGVTLVEPEQAAQEETKKALEMAQQAPAASSADAKISEIIRDAAKDEKTDAEKQADDEAAEALKAPKEEVTKATAAPQKAAEEKQKDTSSKAPDPYAPVAPKSETVLATKTQAAAKLPSPKLEVKAAPVAPVAPSGNAGAQGKAQIQLGAYGSQAEAQQNWAKIRGAHSDVIGSMSPQIVRADLGAKGVYYRLRVAGFGSVAAAKQTCATLSGRGQGCFLVQ